MMHMYMKTSKYILVLAVVLSISYVTVAAQGVYKAWEVRYNGTGSGRDFTEGFTIDEDGFLYICGASSGPGNGFDYQRLDYATVKLTQQGDTVWTRRYNGSANGVDYATDVSVDKNGYVYVTGFSKSVETGHDYFTIKYSSTGDTLWTRRYDGFGSDDEAYALAVDDSGNIYITGFSFGQGTGADFLTLKYSSLGELLWIKRYTGPGSDWDQPFSITLGDSGAIYVAGRSKRRITYEYDWDFTVIKYTSNGDTLWVRFYDGPSHYREDPPFIIRDNRGFIYITGTSFDSVSSADFTTLKFTPNGDSIWVKRYDSPLHGYDIVSDIAVDSGGNVYVTGFGNGDYSDGIYYNTVKYDSSGNLLWVKRHGSGFSKPNSIVVDREQNAYVTGSSNEGTMDYLTVKYKLDGSIEWTEKYNGPDSFSDGATFLLLDNEVNIFVCGNSQGAYSQEDFTIIKYAQNVTAVRDEKSSLPFNLSLSQNYPNPFNPATTISFSLHTTGFVSLEIFNILGQKVKTLVGENLTAGYKQITWDGTNQLGQSVSSGTYFYRLKTENFSETKKMVIMK